ncbi:MAG: class I SAM-dependent methyltransferase [Clostridia bacterium]|nr:class I SAM-dependent methyltransferase [Clostridia bacterium]MDQ7791188.1 class I SAM-dependent methyltransferase [Clostridia bacterium]
MQSLISYVVTTAHSAGYTESEKAHRLAGALRVPFVPRDDRSMAEITREHAVDGVLVVSRHRTSLFVSDQEFFFHPGMAALRIKALLAGKTDQMVKAMDLQEGDRVLDCTLGLASDATVAAHVAGNRGAVIGLEVVPAIAALVRAGMAEARPKDALLAAAIRRVKVVEVDYRDYLCSLSAKSFDVVYFDPMFRSGVVRSSNMGPMRVLADPSPVSRETLAVAGRVAAKAVVVKERRGSPEFARLGLSEQGGGRYASVAYGILRTEGGYP